MVYLTSDRTSLFTMYVYVYIPEQLLPPLRRLRERVLRVLRDLRDLRDLRRLPSPAKAVSATDVAVASSSRSACGTNSGALGSIFILNALI